MSEQELLPCPFCGSQNIQIDFYGNEQQNTMYWALCHGCDAEGPPGSSHAAACEKWNRRDDEMRRAENALASEYGPNWQKAIGLGDA